MSFTPSIFRKETVSEPSGVYEGSMFADRLLQESSIPVRSIAEGLYSGGDMPENDLRALEIAAAGGAFSSRVRKLTR